MVSSRPGRCGRARACAGGCGRVRARHAGGRPHTGCAGRSGAGAHDACPACGAVRRRDRRAGRRPRRHGARRSRCGEDRRGVRALRGDRRADGHARPGDHRCRRRVDPAPLPLVDRLPRPHVPAPTDGEAFRLRHRCARSIAAGSRPASARHCGSRRASARRTWAGPGFASTCCRSRRRRCGSIGHAALAAPGGGGAGVPRRAAAMLGPELLALMPSYRRVDRRTPLHGARPRPQRPGADTPPRRRALEQLAREVDDPELGTRIRELAWSPPTPEEDEMDRVARQAEGSA